MKSIMCDQKCVCGNPLRQKYWLASLSPSLLPPSHSFLLFFPPLSFQTFCCKQVFFVSCFIICPSPPPSLFAYFLVSPLLPPFHLSSNTHILSHPLFPCLFSNFLTYLLSSFLSRSFLVFPNLLLCSFPCALPLSHLLISLCLLIFFFFLPNVFLSFFPYLLPAVLLISFLTLFPFASIFLIILFSLSTSLFFFLLPHSSLYLLLSSNSPSPSAGCPFLQFLPPPCFSSLLIFYFYFLFPFILSFPFPSPHSFIASLTSFAYPPPCFPISSCTSLFPSIIPRLPFVLPRTFLFPFSFPHLRHFLSFPPLSLVFSVPSLSMSLFPPFLHCFHLISFHTYLPPLQLFISFLLNYLFSFLLPYLCVSSSTCFLIITPSQLSCFCLSSSLRPRNRFYLCLFLDLSPPPPPPPFLLSFIPD